MRPDSDPGQSDQSVSSVSSTSTTPAAVKSSSAEKGHTFHSPSPSKKKKMRSPQTVALEGAVQTQKSAL